MWMTSPFRAAVLAVWIATAAADGCAPHRGHDDDDDHRVLLFGDEFTRPLGTRWFVEAEPGGTVAARDGVLDVDVPGGCTVWFTPRIDGPVEIDFEAIAVDQG